ncbi:hypothetical protein [Cellulomonas aerilata]|uniref:hypothetical protein n=1 Tax=Cellulomonas aerilata TaxID=515326 RepID=UPI001649B74A
MTGYEVDIGALRDAATRAQQSAVQAEGADPAGRLGAVGTAMPGSAAAQRAQSLAAAWRGEQGAWVQAAQGHASGLRSSADGYAGHEAGAARRFGDGR